MRDLWHTRSVSGPRLGCWCWSTTLVNFTTAADGVTHLDCTYLTLPQTIDAVLELVAEVTGRTPETSHA